MSKFVIYMVGLYSGHVHVARSIQVHCFTTALPTQAYHFLGNDVASSPGEVRETLVLTWDPVEWCTHSIARADSVSILDDFL